ncbi:MAG: hypothetical protein R3D57_01325 [Hyphomicrobiaceae bacterium]
MLRFRSKLDALQGLKPLTEPPPRYAEWIDYCFGRLQRLDGTDIADQRLACETFHVADTELVPLFEVMMRRSGEDLAPFSDDVVGGGLSLLLDGSLSDFGYRIRNARVAVERKVNAISAMHCLYEQVLEPRCPPLLGHLNETGHARLSYICYMLWDVTALAYWPPEDEGEPLPQAVLAVLERTLDSDNDAVVESGLHGLGHLATAARRRGIIDRMLARRPDLRPDLKSYAEACSLGCMQ